MPQIPEGVSDTSHLASLLSAGPEAVLSTLGLVRGPFAFVLWQPSSRRLWFGRDPLGRRSLLWNIGDGHRLPRALTLTSVGTRQRPDLTEVPCLGVFHVHVPPDCRSCDALQLRLHPWRHVDCIPAPLADAVDAPLACPLRLDVNAALPEPFEAAMLAAVRRRVTNLPPACATCLAGRRVTAPCPHAKLAVLFSGGVDSMLVAALADRCLPASEPIDLLNVAFERTVRTDRGPGSRDFEVPDRLTGRQGWRELRNINPRRQWNFVEADVTAAELAQWRAARVRHLLSPLQTVLDDSIGCAVWFAARGAGTLPEDGRRYQSEARVVLLGMGADEQLAGYGRHRSAFERRGWPGLVAEMQTQLDGISRRNLGRDDRIVSDHGREARLPFLDEAVVSLLSSLPVWLKAQLAPGWRGADKLPVRLLAARCGAAAAARLPKRAIQFGSRIAKLENRAEKAADVCMRLEAAPSAAGSDQTGDGCDRLGAATPAASSDRDR
ncbi:LOW QUALITY PROTEIN: asparagine synthetase domain-containing protein 1-like [Pollicipes pollicipes]|uniref:LOW QUALITY PROTEIN: asparagine synthetase domain-containing protein 1-like n=1 Tax=Pollicipes pollicipes TaxID=41117 RepID=UPI001885A15A|nr:LOW QUALITY PROTEIN: asparagine synthetase domain-containing protein 1-like [Pollicipes pollicipes]